MERTVGSKHKTRECSGSASDGEPDERSKVKEDVRPSRPKRTSKAPQRFEEQFGSEIGIRAKLLEDKDFLTAFAAVAGVWLPGRLFGDVKLTLNDAFSIAVNSPSIQAVLVPNDIHQCEWISKTISSKPNKIEALESRFASILRVEGYMDWKRLGAMLKQKRKSRPGQIPDGKLKHMRYLALLDLRPKLEHWAMEIAQNGECLLPVEDLKMCTYHHFDAETRRIIARAIYKQYPKDSSEQTKVKKLLKKVEKVVAKRDRSLDKVRDDWDEDAVEPDDDDYYGEGGGGDDEDGVSDEEEEEEEDPYSDVEDAESDDEIRRELLDLTNEDVCEEEDEVLMEEGDKIIYVDRSDEEEDDEEEEDDGVDDDAAGDDVDSDLLSESDEDEDDEEDEESASEDEDEDEEDIAEA